MNFELFFGCSSLSHVHVLRNFFPAYIFHLRVYYKNRIDFKGRLSVPNEGIIFDKNEGWFDSVGDTCLSVFADEVGMYHLINKEPMWSVSFQ